MPWLHKLALFLVALTSTVQAQSSLQVGDAICVEGYIMDFFCINRGTLLDRPSVRTLEGPEKHSVHCLVDVGSCIRSPFEVLLDPPAESPGDMYMRGWRLSGSAKDTLVELARTVGGPGCSTCGNGNGMLRQGFRAVLNATIVSLNEGQGIPPTIDVSAALHSNDMMGDGDACAIAFDMANILETMNATDFGIAGVEGSNLRQKHLMHASFMMIGWGWLLPTGVLIAKFFKHRPDGLWFTIHRVCQTVGLLFAIVGFVIALVNFQVWADHGYNNKRHAICGAVTMGLGILQPINALLRPHPAADGEDETSARIVWQIIHKGLGYVAILLAIATIGLGTTILPDPEDQRRFQLAYGIGCGTMLLLVFMGTQYDKQTYTAVLASESKQATKDVEQSS